MSLMHSEYKSRLEHWQRVLAKDFYTPLAPIPFEGFCTMEHLSLDAAAHGPFAPMPEGTEWGHTWEYMWMRSTVTVPAEAANKPLVMSLCQRQGLRHPPCGLGLRAAPLYFR